VARLTPSWRRRSERGFTTVEYTVCVSLSLLVLVWLANLAVFSYGKGAVREAVDEAVRAGSRVDVDSVATCQARAAQVLGNILGGTMGKGVTVSCSEQGGEVRAQATAHFDAWLPPMADADFQLTGEAIKVRAP
jgi:Flp pilus assembly protein TadG